MIKWCKLLNKGFSEVWVHITFNRGLSYGLLISVYKSTIYPYIYKFETNTLNRGFLYGYTKKIKYKIKNK